MELLRLTGEIVSIGDMPAEEVPHLAGVPHLLLRLSDGRDVLVAGLTRDECRACAEALLRPARVTVSDAPLDALDAGGDEVDILAAYSRGDGKREWVSVGTWLRPGEVVAHMDDPRQAG